jgi:flagellar basal-body rod protein FlgB
MNFSQLPLFSMLSQRLGWLNERQKVLAENIANVDTPGYKPKDIKQTSFDQMVRGASSFHMAQTSGKHMGTPANTSSSMRMDKPKPTEVTISGNAVTLDVELMKISQTSESHELATSLYHKQISMFRNVLGGGGGG